MFFVLLCVHDTAATSGQYLPWARFDDVVLFILESVIFVNLIKYIAQRTIRANSCIFSESRDTCLVSRHSDWLGDTFSTPKSKIRVTRPHITQELEMHNGCTNYRGLKLTRSNHNQ